MDVITRLVALEQWGLRFSDGVIRDLEIVASGLDELDQRIDALEQGLNKLERPWTSD